MENSHKLCLYVSYYLSRFDKIAYQNLGYGNKSETHARIGEIMNINPPTIRNWRDEFDPYFGHRLGWHQIRLRPVMGSIIEALQYMEESDVKELVLEILNGKYEQNEESLINLLSVIPPESGVSKSREFILRAPTGRKAEEYFIEHFKINKLPRSGELIDTRDFGVGYDFKVIFEENEYYLEIKGIAELGGGVLFTGTEWNVAKQKGDSYFLIIISDINNTPEINFIQNPAKRLSPKISIVRPIQTNWTVSKKQIEKALSE